MAEDFKVFVQHYRTDGEGNVRRYFRNKDNEFVPAVTGGRTEVTLSFPDGLEITAEALCSGKDHFNYKRGREIAFGRAMKVLTNNENMV